jgi:NAD(P)-dependent dehydrogenase (short-subunit alcohol dehydrogenase family)
MSLKTAIVTGASSGIGLAVAKRLHKDGWAVVANSRNITKAGVLSEDATLRLIDGDIALPETGKALAEAAVKLGGRIDLLVNNAGIFVPAAFEEYTSEQFNQVVATNLAGFFYATQPAVKIMKGQRAGHIVNISTTLVAQPVAGINAALTSITKGGLNAVTQQLALELVSHGIRINAIGAGIIDTPMHAPETHDFLKGLHPMPRLGKTEEIIDAILYLQAAQFVTGEILHVDGGAHAGKW